MKRTGSRSAYFGLLSILMLILNACSNPNQGTSQVAPTSSSPVPSSATALPATALPATATALLATAAPTATETVSGPTLLLPEMKIRKVLDAGGGNIRLALNPKNKKLYLLGMGEGLGWIDIQTGKRSAVASVDEIAKDAVVAGMDFGPDGTIYVVANRRVDDGHTQAIIRRGVDNGKDGFSWTTLASTVPYETSNTPFDHIFNGIAVAPDGTSILVNSGSRTDHGEVESNNGAFPNLREVPLTSAIFRLPADATELSLPNDEAGLKAYLFADGTRNAYDPAFAPNGDLLVGDNGPDADFPDELNWIQQGKHYGFPWKFGSDDNPQQFPDYDGAKDKRLSSDFTAVNTGTYTNDLSFPKAAAEFTAPIANFGPDAVIYRAADGTEHNAAKEKSSLTSFTPHRSPLGLVFADTALVPEKLRKPDDTLQAFILSWGAAGGTLSDKGQDLLHLALTKKGDSYEMRSTQIARDFKNPIDAVLIDQKLYVLEFGGNGTIWELTFGQ